MGMGLETFRRLTPGEFRAVYDVWFDHIETLYHRDLEVGRLVGSITLMPYSTKLLKPTDLIRFPWEKNNGSDAAVPKGTSSKEKMEELWAAWKGLKNPSEDASCERPPAGTSDQGLSQ